MRRLAAVLATTAVALVAAAPADAASQRGEAVMLCAQRTLTQSGERFTRLKQTPKPRACATYDSPDKGTSQVDLIRIKWAKWNRNSGVGWAYLRSFQSEYDEETGKARWPTQQVALRAYAPKKSGRRVIFTRLQVDYESGFRRVYRLPTR